MTEKVSTFQISFKETFDQKEVYIHASARMVPESLAPEINREHILNLLDMNDYGSHHHNLETIDQIVKALNEQLEDIVVEQQAEEIAFDTDTIAYRIDSEASISVPADKLTAKLIIKPAKGGAPLSMEQAKKLLEEAGVTYGVSEQAINDLIQESTTSDAEEELHSHVHYL